MTERKEGLDVRLKKSIDAVRFRRPEAGNDTAALCVDGQECVGWQECVLTGSGQHHTNTPHVDVVAHHSAAIQHKCFVGFHHLKGWQQLFLLLHHGACRHVAPDPTVPACALGAWFKTCSDLTQVTLE